ncbi:NFACT family protein [Campylobacter insulaenigrae]|uniref:NFACT family protein n=1 Tax=Campylobacter insulaenigrae TaxID=260714 RepID=UPI002152D98F|nr:NFACT family protein [Campylobacter insulaenigrae]MCR6577263.1 NFACT family protein [Campylobacter insulaenigrae]
MKYTDLIQIKDYFNSFKRLNYLKRLDDNLLELSLDHQSFIIDLTRSKSAIYQDKIQAKNYNAPFDFMLKKYFSNAKILSIKVLDGNRILRFEVLSEKSYKSYEARIYFEFTGKNTNAIITDANDFIIEALRHIDKSYRIVKIGEKLQALKAYEIKEEIIKIDDFNLYFANKAKEIQTKRLQELKNNKIANIEKKIKFLNESIENLDEEDKLLDKARNLSEKADILFANLNTLKDFQRKFILRDFDGKELLFNLEDSPKNSANDFYKLAKKLKQKAKNINIEREILNEKLDFLINLKTLVCKSISLYELEILMPKKTKKTKKEELNARINSFYFDEFKISVGCNEKANKYLLKIAKKDDLWFHVKDYPGAHVIITSNKLKISQMVLEFAAKLCVEFSRLSSGVYLVDYTSKKFVKVKEKAFVNYTNYKTLSILKE